MGIFADAMVSFSTALFRSRELSFSNTLTLILIMSIFGGPSFIKFNDVPVYWTWLMYMSPYTHATHGALIAVMEGRHYRCDPSGVHFYPSVSNTSASERPVCVGPLEELFPCMSSSRLGDSTCIVRGVDVMTVISGVSGMESKWTSLGYIALIALVLRLLQLFLLLFLEGGTLILAWHRNFKFLWKKKSVAPQPQQSPLHPSPDSHPAPRIKKSSSVLLNLFGVGRGGSLINHGEQSKTGNTVHFFDIGAEGTAQVTTDSRAPSLVWRRVNAYSKSDGRRLLENVSGLAKSGHLLAIMGPSGAGKTTLIQAISNRASHVHAYGDVRYCGRALQEQELIYVPKTVEFNKVLTVQENIELVGCLRCKDLKALKARIEGVYHTLKLKDKLHLRCGDLSAGEVKRVGLCIALVVNPRILVLDEPTS
eukprot:gene6950-8892_t